MTELSANIVIVVPCFNEFHRLDVDAFRLFAESRPHLTFLFVNDGSTDQTAQLIEQLRTTNPQLFETIQLPFNRGKAQAVQVGVQQAFAMEAAYVGFWDADLATPLEMIDVFCSVLIRRPEVEVVFGSRLPLLGHCIHRSSIRGMLGRAFVAVVSLLLGVRIRDTQCGAKLFRSTAITRSLFERPFLSRWIFDVEIVGRLASASRHHELPKLSEMIYECPVDEWREISGGSLRARDFFRAIADLAAIYWHYLRPGATQFSLSHNDHFVEELDSNLMISRKTKCLKTARAA